MKLKMGEEEKIRADPHKYIMDWMEGNLLHVGSKAFEILALQPCSLLLPDIPYGSTGIRSSFNVLFIASPSGGKSSLCKKYSEFAYGPYMQRHFSDAKLSKDLSDMSLFTLIVEDFSQTGGDSSVIKVIEGAIGDERKIQRRTLGYQIDANTIGVGLLCGTWTDLSKYFQNFKGGLLFRCVLLFLELTKKESEEIADFITSQIGDTAISKDLKAKDKIVKDFYDELKTIQGNESGKDHKIQQVKGYYFTPEMRAEILKSWKYTQDFYLKKIYDSQGVKLDFQFNRELHEAYRFLVSSAFLNIHNRKIKDHILYPNNEDLILAKKLMIGSLRNKMAMIQSRLFVSNSTASDIKKVLNSNVDPVIKRILENINSKK